MDEIMDSWDKLIESITEKNRQSAKYKFIKELEYNEENRAIIFLISKMNIEFTFTTRQICNKLFMRYSEVKNILERLERIGMIVSRKEKGRYYYKYHRNIIELYDEALKIQKEQESKLPINIDIVEGNVPQSERGKTLTVLHSITKLSEIKKDITLDELKNELLKENIEWDYEVENILEKLNTQGIVFKIGDIIQKV